MVPAANEEPRRGRIICTKYWFIRNSGHRTGRNGVCCMADRQTAITPREERRLARSRGWDEPFSMMQRLADEMDRMFDDFGIGRRWGMSPQAATSGLPAAWAPEIEVFQKG